MKKKEAIFISIFLLVCLIGSILVFIFTHNKPGTFVRISVDGKEQYLLPLDTDKVIDISDTYGTNTIVISDYRVYVKSADCHDLICVNQGTISHVGENIICLPHKLVITIVSED